jgi:hypothetical protein
MFTDKFEKHFSGTMEKVNRRVVKRWGERGQDMSELGGVWNGYSLVEGGKLGLAVEKVGQAVDQEYLATAALVSYSGAFYTAADLAASSVGTHDNGADAHLFAIWSFDQSTPFLPTPKAGTIRNGPRSARPPKRQARSPRRFRAGSSTP